MWPVLETDQNGRMSMRQKIKRPLTENKALKVLLMNDVGTEIMSLQSAK